MTISQSVPGPRTVPDTDAAQVSVVVISRGRPGELQRCLASLATQGADEVIVCDGAVERLPLEVMREAAVRRARGGLVLFTETCMEPAANWLSTFVSAHAQSPEAGVIGGTVMPAAGLDAANLGLFLCEYDAFRPPAGAAEPRGQHADTTVATRVVDAVSAANVSYRRAAILPLPEPFRWDALLHHRQSHPGLRQCDAAVTFHGGYHSGEAAAMRFHYARAYAARRPLSPVQRLLHAGGTVLLPWILLRRLRRHRAARNAQGAPAAPSAAWIWAFVFLVAWAAGEAVGYVVGAAGEERMR